MRLMAYYVIGVILYPILYLVLGSVFLLCKVSAQLTRQFTKLLFYILYSNLDCVARASCFIE